MTVVQNTVTDPGQNPMSQVGVRITLITSSSNVPGYTSSGEILGTLSLSTDITGHWSANLTPNSTITPANTFYQVVEGQAVSDIVVPASGGPYEVASILVTNPATPSAPGITGVQVAAGGTVAGSRPELNLIAGSNVTISAADDPGANRVDVTVSATGGGGGTPATTVQTATAYSISPAVGSDTSFAREDHQHGTPALPALPAASTSTAGIAQFDGTATDIQPIGTQTAGAIGKTADAGHIHPYQPWQFYVGAYGAKGDNSTDDTGSIRSAIAAAFNYAVAHTGYAEIVHDPKTYLLSAAPITNATFNGATFQGSAQLPIPAQAQAAEHIILAFIGTRDQSPLYNWAQTTPQRAGAVLRSTYAAGASLPATGEVSVLGGPTPHFMGDPPTSWSNVHVVIDGITIEVPTNPQICGIDLRCQGSANVPNAAVLALSAGTGAPQIPDPNWAFGLAMPVANNNDDANIGLFSCEGLVIGLQVYEHVHGDSIRLINCFDGLVCFSSSGFPHRNQFDYVSIENCTQTVVLNGGFNKLDIAVADIEWGSGAIVKDASATPALGRIGITSNGSSGASLNAAMNTGANAVTIVNGAIALEITNLDQAVGPVAAPGIPGNSTALTNPFWREAAVTVTGGTVTAIKIDGVTTGLTAGTVIVPSGHTITLTYSVAPAWVWTLTR